jgi:hypothetical protein
MLNGDLTEFTITGSGFLDALMNRYFRARFWLNRAAT